MKVTSTNIEENKKSSTRLKYIRERDREREIGRKEKNENTNEKYKKKN